MPPTKRLVQVQRQSAIDARVATDEKRAVDQRTKLQQLEHVLDVPFAGAGRGHLETKLRPACDFFS